MRDPLYAHAQSNQVLTKLSPHSGRCARGGSFYQNVFQVDRDVTTAQLRTTGDQTK